MPEEYPARRAPTCAITGLPGPESTHPENLSTFAQAPAGTVKLISRPTFMVLWHALSLWIVASTHHQYIHICKARKTIITLPGGLKLGVEISVTLLHFADFCNICFSFTRAIPLKPDLVSVVLRQPETRSKKQLLSQRQTRPLEVNTVINTSYLYLYTVDVFLLSTFLIRLLFYKSL